MEQIINQELFEALLSKASESPRLRQNYDLRTSEADTSQRILNALLPGTEVPIHRHEETAETVVCIRGRLEEIIYEEVAPEETAPEKRFKEIARHLLCPAEAQYGIQIPKGVWHTIHVLEPSLTFDAKDGAYRP
jgi:cupin fold WbuC family metalloprotein